MAIPSHLLSPSCNYSLSTSSHDDITFLSDGDCEYPKEMKIKESEQRLVYLFDLADKSKWARFYNDGSSLPEAPKAERFSTITGIVIEPGVWDEGLYSASTQEKTEGDENIRYLAPSPCNADGSISKSSFVVLSISLRKAHDKSSETKSGMMPNNHDILQ